MIRSALLLCTAVVTALCVGCIPPTDTPPAPTPSMAPRMASAAPRVDQSCYDGSRFLAHVKRLKTSFDPEADKGIAPPEDGSVSQDYGNKLQQAYAIAPTDFQKHLCDLDRIYVDDRPCNPSCFATSWGLRRNLSGGTIGRYVGISSGFLKDFPTISKYETDLFKSILGIENDPWLKTSSFAAIPDNSELALLAALAHELGHVRWYDISAKNGFNGLCPGGFFQSWSTVDQPPLWRRLLTRSERGNSDQQTKNTHAHDDADLSSIDILFPPTLDFQIRDKLSTIYAPSSSWASLFAATSPDEDFVESYKLYVLTHAQKTPLASLALTLSVSGFRSYLIGDIPSDYIASLKSVLAAKFVCVQNSMGI